MDPVFNPNDESIESETLYSLNYAAAQGWFPPVLRGRIGMGVSNADIYVKQNRIITLKYINGAGKERRMLPGAEVIRLQNLYAMGLNPYSYKDAKLLGMDEKLRLEKVVKHRAQSASSKPL